MGGVSGKVTVQKSTHLTGCSKSSSSEAAGESKPEAYPQGYVEDFDEPRTKLAGFFSILLTAKSLLGRLQFAFDNCADRGQPLR